MKGNRLSSGRSQFPRIPVMTGPSVTRPREKGDGRGERIFPCCACCVLCPRLNVCVCVASPFPLILWRSAHSYLDHFLQNVQNRTWGGAEGITRIQVYKTRSKQHLSTFPPRRNVLTITIDAATYTTRLLIYTTRSPRCSTFSRETLQSCALSCFYSSDSARLVLSTSR